MSDPMDIINGLINELKGWGAAYEKDEIAERLRDAIKDELEAAALVANTREKEIAALKEYLEKEFPDKIQWGVWYTTLAIGIMKDLKADAERLADLVEELEQNRHDHHVLELLLPITLGQPCKICDGNKMSYLKVVDAFKKHRAALGVAEGKQTDGQ